MTGTTPLERELSGWRETIEALLERLDSEHREYAEDALDLLDGAEELLAAGHAEGAVLHALVAARTWAAAVDPLKHEDLTSIDMRSVSSKPRATMRKDRDKIVEQFDSLLVKGLSENEAAAEIAAEIGRRTGRKGYQPESVLRRVRRARKEKSGR